MIPLIGIAVSVIPKIVDLIAGDKAGNLASAVSSVVRSVTGTEDPVEAQARVESNAKMAADLREKLAQIALDAAKTQEAARQAELDELKAALVDTQSARSTMTGLVEAHSPLAWGAAVVSVLVTVGFFATLALLMIHPIASGDPNVFALLNLAFGVLMAGESQVISYWIGSSAGSRNKDNALGAVATNMTAPVLYSAGQALYKKGND